MNLIKKYLNRVFIDGLSGMALGLFATLIIGTIIQQIGTLAGGSIGALIYAVGKVAAGLTCAGIGVGVAYKFQESPMVVLSAATSGMIGGYDTEKRYFYYTVFWVFVNSSLVLKKDFRTGKPFFLLLP